MTRKPLFACFLGIFLAVASVRLNAQKAPAQPDPAQQTPAQPSQPNNQGTPQAVPVPDDSGMEEEDESAAPEKFVLNPLESDRNVRVGNFYWHKGAFRAALKRYEYATKYNPSSPEAYFKVGEAEEKLKNRDAAKLAFRKVMDLAPDSKLGREAKKKLASLS